MPQPAIKLKRPKAKSTNRNQYQRKLMRQQRNADRVVAFRCPDKAEIKRRAKLERNPEAWLRHYLPERFPLPFGPVHKEIVKACVRGMNSGTSVTVAAPRGFGKTAIEWGMALYGVLSGKARFPVVIGWKANAGAELLDQWVTALSTNEILRAAYPCVCDCFKESTASKRLQGILRCTDPEELAGCDVRKGRGTVLLPATKEPGGRSMPQAALAGASMNGSIKGLNVGLLNGESLRPDIILLDDPQDTATAASEKLIATIIRRIDYGLRSLSGPQRRLTVMAAVTCVEIGDVAEHLLTRPGTESIRCGQVVKWPDGWDDKESQTRQLWDEWNATRLDGLTQHDGGKAARGYYRRHKKAMTAGMAVSWKHRYHVGDKERPSDPDALYAAMWDYYDLGEFAFMAERQNQPLKQGVTLYNLNADIIKSRVDNRQPNELPTWAKVRVAGTDINPSYGLTWALVAFGADQSAAVMNYGIHRMNVPGGATKGETDRAIYEQLAIHGKALAALPNPPEVWGIDAGGAAFDVVLQFAAHSVALCGLQAIAMTGRGNRNYRPWGKSTLGKPREQCHMTSDARGRKWLTWNADYWREIMQKSWTGSVGAPGACSLPSGRHDEFADQICREQLAGKGEVGGVPVWIWNTAPGAHDYPDALNMCYAGVAWAGIGTAGMYIPPRQVRRETRRCKIQLEM